MYQLFKPKFRKKEILAEVETCLDKGWTGLGYKTIEIEELWRNKFGFNHSHFLSSNTAGLFLAFELFRDYYKWNNDSEIISTPCTFVATNHAILNAGLKVKFADVDLSLNLSAESVKKCINGNTKAIIFVGIGGNTKNYREIRRIAKENNLLFILDAAHMAGSFINGAHAGNDADVSIFSFQAVKNMPSADAGMICFKKKEFDEISRKRSWLGIDKDTFKRINSKGNYKWDYDVDHVSNKYHGNSIMASICSISLKYLDEDNQRRREIASIYKDELYHCKNLSFIEHEDTESTFSSRHLTQIILKKEIDRDSFILRLNERGIYPGVHYKSNSFYRPYKHLSESVQFTENITKRIVSLPIHLELTDSDAKFISTIVSQLSQFEQN